MPRLTSAGVLCNLDCAPNVPSHTRPKGGEPMKGRPTHLLSLLTTDAANCLRKSGTCSLMMQKNRKVALALVVLLSAAFPLGAQQFSGQARTGVLTRVGTVDPLHSSAATNAAPKNATLATPAVARQRGARMLQAKIPASAASAQSRPTSTAAETGQMQMLSPTLLASEKSNVILSNFDGVSSLDSAITNFGAGFEPPDQGLCVGNGF